MSTGDVKGSLRKLELQLRALKYPREVDYSGLAKGDPSSFLPVLSYAFISYSPHLAEHLVAFGVELAGKSDLRFIESMYKVLRDLFHYKPMLTKQQFLQFGFAERKIGFLCDIIGFVTKKHAELSKRSKPDVLKRYKACFPPANPPCRTEAFLPETDVLRAEMLTKQPLVERNFGCTMPTFSMPLSHDEDLEVEEEEHPKEEDQQEVAIPVAEDQEVSFNVNTERLKALEVQLEDFQVKLERISILERRLKALERDMAGKIVIDRQEWNNLESRVLLLETRLTLTSGQKDSSVFEESNARPDETELRSKLPECPLGDPPSAADTHLAALTDAPKVDIRERLERIANLMKDTTCLLKSVDPSV
ncbi:centrosomal protein of 44 kDa isoform X1 [Arapaima gigas]